MPVRALVCDLAGVSDMVPDLSLRDLEHGVKFITKFSTASTTIVYECVHVLSQTSVLNLATTAVSRILKYSCLYSTVL